MYTVNVAEDPGADVTTHHVDVVGAISCALAESVESYLVSSNSLASCLKSNDDSAFVKVCTDSSNVASGKIEPNEAMSWSVEYVVRNLCNWCHSEIT